MARTLSVKPVVNKRNGQINFSLPKRKLSKKQILEIKSSKKIKIKFE